MFLIRDNSKLGSILPEEPESQPTGLETLRSGSQGIGRARSLTSRPRMTQFRSLHLTEAANFYGSSGLGRHSVRTGLGQKAAWKGGEFRIRARGSAHENGLLAAIHLS